MLMIQWYPKSLGRAIGGKNLQARQVLDRLRWALVAASVLVLVIGSFLAGRISVRSPQSAAVLIRPGKSVTNMAVPPTTTETAVRNLPSQRRQIAGAARQPARSITGSPDTIRLAPVGPMRGTSNRTLRLHKLPQKPSIIQRFRQRPKFGKNPNKQRPQPHPLLRLAAKAREGKPRRHLVPQRQFQGPPPAPLQSLWGGLRRQPDLDPSWLWPDKESLFRG